MCEVGNEPADGKLGNSVQIPSKEKVATGRAIAIETAKRHSATVLERLAVDSAVAQRVACKQVGNYDSA